ncbi:MAG TPA: histidine triad nucleotide-binding protein [Sphingobacteriaceae bacterium]|nr:histidine triad nucleotide-binding protein [Sphingobacteriaceae bacterium]
MADCIFCDIVRGRVPAEVVYEDDLVMAFHDINPQAPVHVLIIPKEHVAGVLDLSDDHEAVAGRIQTAAAKIARQLDVADRGFRLVANCGSDGGQTVFHLHYHLLAGRALRWPPG